MPQESPVKHVVVLVDGTASSYRAADRAIQAAARNGAALTAMAIVEHSTLRQLLRARILVAEEMDEFERDLDASMRGHLAEVRLRALRQNVNTETVLLAGNTASLLPKYVAEHHVDLVVVAASRFKDVLRDVIAHQRQLIVDHSPCPVLVVK
jgi:nucleotide-binding universal stress UspA family protein